VKEISKFLCSVCVMGTPIKLYECNQNYEALFFSPRRTRTARRDLSLSFLFILRVLRALRGLSTFYQFKQLCIIDYFRFPNIINPYFLSTDVLGIA
jgi:hypothetical protein